MSYQRRNLNVSSWNCSRASVVSCGPAPPPRVAAETPPEFPSQTRVPPVIEDGFLLKLQPVTPVHYWQQQVDIGDTEGAAVLQAKVAQFIELLLGIPLGEKS